MIPECSRPVMLDRIGPNGLSVTIEATPAECGALALRMDLPAIHAMTCAFRLERMGHDVIVAHGHLRAEVMQTCVITSEDFDATVNEEFRIRFVPEGEGSVEIDPEDDDEIPYAGNQIDIGEAAAEQLGLALDPYPRIPGSELAAPDEAEEPSQPNPFAALRRRLD